MALPGYNIQSLFRVLPQHTVSLRCAKALELPQNGFLRGNQYLKLCQALGKSAHFLYDLDSLFGGNLRACIKDDESVQSFLASAGLGNDFGLYCGQLEQELTTLIAKLINADLPENLRPLKMFLNGLGEKSLWKHDQWRKARTAAMTALSRHRGDMVPVASLSVVESIEGRLAQILTALSAKNIHDSLVKTRFEEVPAL